MDEVVDESLKPKPAPLFEAGKIISTSIRHYPSIDSCGYVEITTVLVSGAINDYAAYTGQGWPDWVARHGDKISFREASCHFPNIKEENYWL